jgi:hypothetical protein
MFAKPFPPERLAQVGADGFVSTEDVLFLRRQVFKDGIVSAAELDGLFSLAERAPKGDLEWPAYFEEAACDFYLRQEEPQGYFTQEEFDTLKARVTRDGQAASLIELRLMIKLMETAVDSPAEMRGFVASQLKQAIIGKPEGVSKGDVDLVRRLIFAKGGDGNIAVTRAEAELLFDLNDKARDADPSWTVFFIKAIANYLMAHLGYAPPSLEEAKRQHAFVSDHSIDVGGFLKRMVQGGLSGLKAGGQSAQARRNADRERDAKIAETVTPEEADWLADRIAKDGELHESERALVDYIRDLGAELPPRLKALVAKAA